jgi:stage II sporulation protein AA (anti-sigma F factor antagonist)
MKNPNEPNLFVKTADQEGKDFTVVYFDGDLDKNGLDAVKDEVDAVVENLRKKRIVFDFTNLNFINSESIGYVITVYYRVIKKEKELVIVGATAHVLDVLQVIGITQLVKSFGSIDDFEQSLSKQK